MGQKIKAEDQGHFPLSQNFQLEILQTFRVRGKGFFSSRPKLAISLVDKK